MKNLAVSVKSVASASANAVNIALNAFELVSDVFGVAGIFLSFLDFFGPDED